MGDHVRLAFVADLCIGAFQLHRHRALPLAAGEHGIVARHDVHSFGRLQTGGHAVGRPHIEALDDLHRVEGHVVRARF